MKLDFVYANFRFLVFGAHSIRELAVLGIRMGEPHLVLNIAGTQKSNMSLKMSSDGILELVPLPTVRSLEIANWILNLRLGKLLYRF